MILDTVTPSDELDARGQRYVNVKINASDFGRITPKEFMTKINSSKGNARLILELHDENETRRICLNGCNVDPDKLNESLSLIF